MLSENSQHFESTRSGKSLTCNKKEDVPRKLCGILKQIWHNGDSALSTETNCLQSVKKPLIHRIIFYLYYNDLASAAVCDSLQYQMLWKSQE